MAPQTFRGGLVQMSCGPDPEGNLEKALERIGQAAARGAQLVCLPELFQTQYFCQREDPGLFDLAEPIPGPASVRLAEAARRHGVVLLASLFERRAPGVYHNSAVLFDADGSDVRILVIQTNEELAIARRTYATLSGAAAAKGGAA